MSVNSFMKLLREKQQTKPSPPRSAAVVLSRALPTATSKCDEPPTVCRSQSRLGAGVLMEKIVGLYSKSSGLFFFLVLLVIMIICIYTYSTMSRIPYSILLWLVSIQRESYLRESHGLVKMLV